MLLPEIKNDISTQRGITSLWNGLSLREGAEGGKLVASKQLTSELYPALSSKRSDSVHGEFTQADGVFGWDKLVVTDGGKLYYGDDFITTVSIGNDKQFAVVNTSLCVWPDKLIINLENNEVNNLGLFIKTTEGSITKFSGNTVEFSQNFYEGKTQQFTSVGVTTSSEKELDSYFINTYSNVSWNKTTGWTLEGEEEKQVHRWIQFVDERFELSVGDIVMLQQSTISGEYTLNAREFRYDYLSETFSVLDDYQENNTEGYYAKITNITEEYTYNNPLHIYKHTVQFDIISSSAEYVDMTKLFRPDERVIITGASTEENNKEEIKIVSVTENVITLESASFTTQDDTNSIEVKRKYPEMDYICERDNRLWGVSNEDKTIYASALGDPLVFYDFSGESTDSYAVAVGSAGIFTGIAAYASSVICFKEDTIHRIVGDYPETFSMYTDKVEGLQEGSFRSIEIVNEVLYYKGRKGIYAYTGGQPSLISYALGVDLYTDAVAGNDGKNYYISMKNGDKRILFAYDVLHSAWTEIGEQDISSFTRLFEDFYYTSGGVVYLVNGGEYTNEWSFEFAPYDEDIYSLKQYIRLRLTFELFENSSFKMLIAFDDNAFTELLSADTAGIQYKTIVLPMKRTHRMYIKGQGVGKFILRDIEREYIPCSEESL